MKIDDKSYFCYLNKKKYHGMTTCKQKKRELLVNDHLMHILVHFYE